MPSKANHNAIGDVPIELFLKIVQHLPPESIRAVSYTSSSLYRIFGDTATQLMGESPYRRARLELQWNVTASKIRNSNQGIDGRIMRARERGKWWNLLVMLQRGGMWPGQAVCNACLGVHKKTAFSQGSLQGPKAERECLSTTGWVYICPHKQFDFFQLRKTCNSPEAYKKLVLEDQTRASREADDRDKDAIGGAWRARLNPEQLAEADTKRARRRKAREEAYVRLATEEEDLWTLEKEETCHQCCFPVTITSWAKSRVCFPIAVMSQKNWKKNRFPSTDDLIRHLQGVEMPVCPHLKLDSPAVTSAYFPKCKRLESGWRGWDCDCKACSVPYHECARCNARFWYDIGDFPGTSHLLHLVVERSFDPTGGVAGPWVNQLVPKTAYREPSKIQWPPHWSCHRRHRSNGDYISDFNMANGDFKGNFYPHRCLGVYLGQEAADSRQAEGTKEPREGQLQTTYHTPVSHSSSSDAFFDCLIEFGIKLVFVNLGSDHPSIIEAITKGKVEKKDAFPQILTCPNEMVALSMADGYARFTGKPQCVIVHVDVGTQGLGAAVHNASCGRAPVLIFAGLSPYTCEGELRGSRTEYIHWIQDVPDQKQIVAQYCRYTGEIKRGVNVKQMVGRALQFALSAPMGPVYLVGSREAMEEEIPEYSLNVGHWGPVGAGALPENAVMMISEALVDAKEPLLITGYAGRNHAAVGELVKLTENVKGLRVLDTGGSDMSFPSDHRAGVGLRYGVDDSVKTADLILVVDCDVPWIPTICKPKHDARVFHIDADPLKQQMPVFYIPAEARFKGDCYTSIHQINEYTNNNPAFKHKLESHGERWENLQRVHDERMTIIRELAQPSKDGYFNASYLCSEIRKAVPEDTIFAIEAVTSTGFVADQILPRLPGTWLNCGGGGLGWSAGGALGIKLAAGEKKFVCQIVGDGTFLFSVPGSAYWISQRYNLPFLTIVLNNQGWNAPRRSLLLVHPSGHGSKATNDDLNLSFAPSPDYAGIAKAAAGGNLWAGHATTVDELRELLPKAIESVKAGVGAVLDAHLEGPQGKYGGGKAVLVG